MFYVKKLRKDPDNPLPGQSNAKLAPLHLSDGLEEYEVQEVLAVRRVSKKLKYKI
jgi:hypothetical protein